MKEESLISRRRIYDTIASKGVIEQVSISKEMLKYARNARATYAEAADVRRREQHEKVTIVKRKREAALQMKSLKAKTKILQEAEKQRSAIEEEIVALRIQKQKI
ncbi:hypothetical protein JTE90_008277 [Oedothorax gibbosus]|uniref:Uncharacterized protein n=1 Tax=Oedothorax gibbosus TaxID=931172 RepID=A0AAV6UFX8_9ARAC|nr:hypothetical protein JTE90_008277 [Oedothorax gibbosus]